MLKVWSPTGLTGKKLAFCTVFIILALLLSLQHPFLLGFFIGAAVLFYFTVLGVIVRFGFYWKRESIVIDGEKYDLRYFIKPFAKSECNKELVIENSNFFTTIAPLFELKNKAIENWPFFDIIRISLIQSGMSGSVRCLVLGGGGGSMPLLIHSLFPQANIDVVELSAEMVKISKQYFIKNNKKIHIYQEDAANYLSRCKKKYDFIIVDIFNGAYVNPLVTNQKFLTDLKSALEKSGKLIANIGFFTEVYPIYKKWRENFDVSIYRDRFNIFFSTIDLTLTGQSLQVILRSPESLKNRKAQFHFLQSLKENKKILVKITTESMIPSYYPGDVVSVKKKKFENIMMGDVIVFQKSADSLPIAHRVIKIQTNGTLQTKGDNNQSPDTFEVKKANYIGLAGKVNGKKSQDY